MLTRFPSISVTLRLLILAVSAASLSFAQQSMSTDIRDHQQTIQELQKVAQNWRLQADIQIGFVIGVILFGALITVFQGMSKGWAKPATVVLGACTTIFTAVNAKVFSADYRVFQQSAIDADMMTDQMKQIIRRESHPNANVDDLESQFLSLTTQFRSLQRAVTLGTAAKPVEGSPSAPSGAALFPFLSIVHAQEAAQSDVPSWVTKTPTGPYSLYFVGIGQDTSIVSAQKQSIDNAVAAAVKQVSAGRNTDTERLTSFITSSSLIESKYFTFDDRRGLYVYYTLLHISDDIRKLDFSPKPTEKPCAHATIKERTWQHLLLPGGDGSATLALGNLYRVSRGPDASHLYIIGNSLLYTGTSGKFSAAAKPTPADMLAEFKFSTPKDFPTFKIRGNAYHLRITSLNHDCLTAGCQSLTLEVCLVEE